MKRLLVIIWLSLLVGISFFSCSIMPTGTTTASEPPTIIEFAAHPTTISFGKSTILVWNVANATSVQINQGIGRLPIAGTMEISPRYTTLYTLTASNSAGSNYATVTIEVTSPFSIPLQPD